MTHLIPLVDLKAQYRAIKTEVDAAIARVLDNTSFILGNEVMDFEKAFAAYIGVKEAVGVASGTAALHLALVACGITEGNEVITTAHTFIATAEAISMVGAKPVFVDIDPKTYTLDSNQIEDAISDRTRAILPVHIYGHPADMESIMDIARRHNIWVIEDAAQAHGAEYGGRRCGSMGHLACFSFYPGKNLGAYGDGGAVTGNDDILIERVRKLRNHGRLSKYEHDEIGYGERLDALQAAILGVKLKHLEMWTNMRRRLADLYTRHLNGVATPYEAPAVRHVYHLYVIRTSMRDMVLQHLEKKGISAGIHYPVPLHRQPAYLKLGYGDVRLPVTEKIADEILSLPIYPEMTEDQIDFVATSMKEVAGD